MFFQPFLQFVANMDLKYKLILGLLTFENQGPIQKKSKLRYLSLVNISVYKMSIYFNSY